MLYTLMNKNTAILEMEDGIVLKISKIHDINYAPLGILHMDQTTDKRMLNRWFKNRSIPASRIDLKYLIDSLHIDTSLDLIEKSFALSLSDQYWIRPQSSNLKWSDINYFTNPFSHYVGDLMFSLHTAEDDYSLASPDNTTEGVLKKRWQIMNGTRCLIKGGVGIINQEPYNEVLATKLHKLLNHQDYVSYRLICINNNVYSCCEDFIDENHELISASDIFDRMKFPAHESLYQHFVKAAMSLNIPNVISHLDYLIVFDYLMANVDRHFRNFGAIRNVETLRFERMAPVFDNGTSLYTNIATDNISTAVLSSKMFRKDIEKQLELVTDFSWIDIEAISLFPDIIKTVFSQNKEMSDIRIQAISNAVDRRIKHLKHVMNKI